ncbi:S-layer homology domain-containing protein [Radiobacillus deserti]|uniref:S-layer homology domain-containing protein n=1 Tax=Radiobacillus deserti TaxID=2594883 RepID=A0A516KJL5_9BACI|nr:S-layer homology domain-containing protein [Radiobacillus deserti]QDP41588.1 S-layer homology domain-containing protein [Radiobacillus deserti]
MKQIKGKKLMTSLLAAALTTTLLTTPVFAKEFTDIDRGASHYDSVTALYDAGIVSGYTDGTFGVNDKLQRRHGAALFAKSLSLPVPSDVSAVLKEYYVDVPSNDPYASIIATVTPSIFKGSNGIFGATQALTREQMATTIVKAIGLTDNGTNPGINLSNVSASHKANVKILAQYGITNQFSNFSPGDSVTRGQFATFLQKALNAKVSPSIALEDGFFAFNKLAKVTLQVSNPADYKVYAEGDPLEYKNGAFVGVVETTSLQEVKNSLLVIKK